MLGILPSKGKVLTRHYLRCVLFFFGKPENGSLIQGHLDHGASKEPTNPRWKLDSSFPLMHRDPSDLGSRVSRKLRPRKLRPQTLGAIHSTKISGNFGPKLNGSVRSNRKSFGKTGPPFEVVLFSRSDRLEFWLNGSRPLKTQTRLVSRKLRP